MRLHNLTIENFRSFQNYKLDGLARVNLVVGENNCGKTSVLEASYLASSSEPLDVLIAITRMRGETCLLNEDSPNQLPTMVPTVDSLFFGRLTDFIGGSNRHSTTLKIAGEATHAGSREISEFTALVRDWQVPNDWLSLTPESLREHPNLLSNAPLRLEIDWKYDVFGSTRKIWMTRDSGLLTHLWAGNDAYESASNLRVHLTLKHAFIPFVGWDARTLANRWTHVVETGDKQIVIEGLRVLHPNIEDVIFLPGLIGLSQRLGGIMIQLTDEKRPVPLTSIGDGSQRLLVMATAVSSSIDGTLFIDEIDTGLHYSKLPDMWRMMITAAIKNNVQVTATTHSLDCIRALATVCDDDESLRDEVALFSIDRRMDEAVRYSGEEILSVIAHEIEVR